MSGRPGSIDALRAQHGERYRWLLLLSVMVGTMASIMSSTIINVAIPDMSQHFTLGQERAQWVSSGFMAAMTVSMLTTPWLLARYGYRSTYAGCMWLLLVGGVAGGLANDYPLVLAARVAEGLAAGVVQPIPAIIILRAFEPHEQGRASGIFGMGVVLAPAIGPSIGGLLVDGFGWRSIFFMVVPFCIASLWLAQRFVPGTAPGGGAANPQGSGLDWRGLLLASVGTLCLLNGLVELQGGTPLAAGVLLAGAAGLLVLFVVLQRRTLRARQRHPVQPLAPPAARRRTYTLERLRRLPGKPEQRKTQEDSAGTSSRSRPRPGTTLAGWPRGAGRRLGLPWPLLCDDLRPASVDALPLHCVLPPSWGTNAGRRAPAAGLSTRRTRCRRVLSS